MGRRGKPLLLPLFAARTLQVRPVAECVGKEPFQAWLSRGSSGASPSSCRCLSCGSSGQSPSSCRWSRPVHHKSVPSLSAWRRSPFSVSLVGRRGEPLLLRTHHKFAGSPSERGQRAFSGLAVSWEILFGRRCSAAKRGFPDALLREVAREDFAADEGGGALGEDLHAIQRDQHGVLELGRK
jgi:hypothetical protein